MQITFNGFLPSASLPVSRGRIIFDERIAYDCTRRQCDGLLMYFPLAVCPTLSVHVWSGLLPSESIQQLMCANLDDPSTLTPHRWSVVSLVPSAWISFLICCYIFTLAFLFVSDSIAACCHLSLQTNSLENNFFLGGCFIRLNVLRFIYHRVCFFYLLQVEL